MHTNGSTYGVDVFWKILLKVFVSQKLNGPLIDSLPLCHLGLIIK